jgi:hypothetical protein
MKLSTAILMLAIFHPVSAGKIYRWVDNSGQVHFSDRAPIGENHQTQTRITTGGKAASTGGGMRAGEYDLLKQAAARHAAVLRSRKAASRAYAARSKRCDKATERYNDALRDSISGGEDERERVKDYYAAMKAGCR